jgi:hypothetical protein
VLSFSEALEAIKAFVVRNDKSDSTRALMCGVGWLPEGLAINIHQLRHLLPKCKSSINGSLQKLGYSISLRRGECSASILRELPCLRGNTPEVRKWSVRRKPDSTVIINEKSVAPVFQISLDGLLKAEGEEEAIDLARGLESLDFSTAIDGEQTWSITMRRQIGDDEISGYDSELWVIDK